MTTKCTPKTKTEKIEGEDVIINKEMIDGKEVVTYTEKGSGLYQWVISTSDHSASAFTSHTVCRTGKLARIEPSCSFLDCFNDECSLCKSDILAAK